MSKLQELEKANQQVNADRAALSEEAKRLQRAMDAERSLNVVREMTPVQREQLAQAIQAVGIESAEASDEQGGS